MSGKVKLSDKIYLIVVCLFISSFLHILLPASLEAYEKFFSVLVSGTFTDFSVKDYDTDVQFLLFSLYSYVNKLYPTVQVYGYVIILYNILSLLLFGQVLFHLLSQLFSSIKLKIAFPIFFLIIASFQVINLSSTRIVVISCASLFYLVHFKILNNNLLLILFLFFLSLMRIDACLLASFIFLLISFFTRNIRLNSCIPVIVSLSVFLIFNLMMKLSDREAKKVYYYRELDLFDRCNIDYEHLSNADSLYVSMLSDHSIMDANHFNMNYVTKILKTKNSGFINSFIDFNLFKNTLHNSLPDILYAKWLIILCFIVIVTVCVYYKPSVKYILLLLLLFILPFFLCLYISLPLRFIEPYYIMLTVFLAASYLNCRFLYVTFSTLLILAFSNIKSCKQRYDNANNNFQTNYNYLMSEYSDTKPIIIESIFTGYFFSPDPLFNYSHTNALFLNFVFFNSYESYMDKWRSICSCNPLSLVQKLETVSRKHFLFISNDETVLLYKKYIYLCWNRNIEFVPEHQINNDMIAYRVLF